MNVPIAPLAPLADTIVLKNTRYSTLSYQLRTTCTRCGKSFKTEFRRMSKTSGVVRNIPQCPTCRGRYSVKNFDSAEKSLAKKLG